MLKENIENDNIKLTWNICCEWCSCGPLGCWKPKFGPIWGWAWWGKPGIGGLGCGGKGGCSGGCRGRYWLPVFCKGCCDCVDSEGIGGWWSEGCCEAVCCGNWVKLGTWEDCGIDIGVDWAPRCPLGCCVGCEGCDGMDWGWGFGGGIDWDWELDTIGWFACCFLIWFWPIWPEIGADAWILGCWFDIADGCGFWDAVDEMAGD